MRLLLCAYCLGIAIATLMQRPDPVLPALLALVTLPLLVSGHGGVRRTG